MTPRKRIIPVFIPHLGCPYQCVFCNQKLITGQDYAATEASVKTALEAAGCRNDAKCLSDPYEVAFYGGSFTAIPAAVQEKLLSMILPYREQGWISSIRCSTRPDAISSDILEMLCHYGVDTVELGCQSMDDSVLKASGRGHDSKSVLNASRLVHDHGMHLVLQMMTGLPGSSLESDCYTAERLIRLSPDGVRIYPTVILRDTPLYQLWQNGDYKEHTVEDAVIVCSKIVPMFQMAKIPIIRLGLNPNDELTAGDAAGGAYHPAFGELVYSRIMLNKVLDHLSGQELSDIVDLHVSPAYVSKMTGNQKHNIIQLSAQFPQCIFRVVPDPSVPAGEVEVPLQKG